MEYVKNKKIINNKVIIVINIQHLFGNMELALAIYYNW